MFRSSIALQAQTRLMGKQCPSCSPWTAKVHRWAAEQRQDYFEHTLDSTHEGQLKASGFRFDKAENISIQCVTCQVKKRCGSLDTGAFAKLKPFLDSIRGQGDENSIEKCTKALESLILESFPYSELRRCAGYPCTASDRLVHLVLQIHSMVENSEEFDYFLHRCELLLETYIQRDVLTEATKQNLMFLHLCNYSKLKFMSLIKPAKN